MEEALAKAHAIAAKLAGNIGTVPSAAPAPAYPSAPPAGTDSALGKRRWDDELNTGGSGARPGGKFVF